MSKVVSLSYYRAKKEVEKDEKSHKASEDVDFEKMFAEAVKKNEENKKRVAEDRKKANKSVLRSYRIKD
jgi:hypothetical protein